MQTRQIVIRSALHPGCLYLLENRGTQYLFHAQHHNRAMKNITIKLEDDVAYWPRVWAAELNTSVSRTLGNHTTINPFLVDSNALKY